MICILSFSVDQLQEEVRQGLQAQLDSVPVCVMEEVEATLNRAVSASRADPQAVAAAEHAARVVLEETSVVQRARAGSVMLLAGDVPEVKQEEPKRQQTQQSIEDFYGQTNTEEIEERVKRARSSAPASTKSATAAKAQNFLDSIILPKATAPVPEPLRYQVLSGKGSKGKGGTGGKGGPAKVTGSGELVKKK